MSEREYGGGALLGRAKKIGTVLGRTALARDGGSPEQQARRLRLALEELGPTFAKLGQILSTRPDLLPEAFVVELGGLQDKVAPLTEAEVVQVMEEELGVPWEDVFERIDPEPLAAGTIAQVHRARLETGDRVVVKVQRPAARDEILRDLGLLELFVEKAGRRPGLNRVVDFGAVLEHLSASLRRELDFRGEAENAERLREVLGPFSRLDVPRVYERLTTSRLLVLEEIEGVPVREAPDGQARREAGRQLLECYYHQILIDGFFHADPHPGNLLWRDDTIYFLDVGMVGEVAPETRELVLLLLLAFWQEDVDFLADLVLMLSPGEPPVDLDLSAFQSELGEVLMRYRRLSLREIQLGPVLQGITEVATRHGVQLTAELALTGKALAQMQMTAAELDPELDPFSVVGSFVARNVLGRVRGGADPKRLFYDVRKGHLRVTRLLDAAERVMGSRPGPKLQIEIRAIRPLEASIRAAARRISLAVTAGSALVAAGTTAASGRVEAWVPLTLGVAGATLTAMLLFDLLRRR
ncbi:MAG: AarF/ABC1/UbiB kinase family protein [Actinobacteria bacterium]|nr:MAG: AarF/ABC1/UbiB kinase family protein [Actinomycetota bacterium]